MYLRFTPSSIIHNRQYRTISLVLIVTMVLSSAYYLLKYNLATATATYTWSAETTLAAGTNASTTVSEVVELATAGSVSDTTVEDFRGGITIYDGLKMSAVSQAGEVQINQGWAYNTFSNPALGRSLVSNTFLQGNLLYVNTYTGLSVINTQGTVDPGDDTLAATYNASTTPALGGNNVYHISIQDNLLYIGTWGAGLSVIDTQGTVDPADDTLVTRYHTGSTPALGSNIVFQALLQDNLLYVITYGAGLSVIDTQGTVDPADDMLVTRYHTGSTPALASNYAYQTFLQDNFLYVSTSGGGLSVINTQGTVDSLDDTLVATYNTLSTPALVNGYVSHTSLQGNLIYVSTQQGLSVINTQGTVDSLDDTLVITYNTASTPALGDDFINHTSLQGNLIYVSTRAGGLSVINTQGTVDPSDDTISTYNPFSIPDFGGNTAAHTSLQGNLIYVSTNYGLFVINLDGNHNNSGIYTGNPRALSTTPTTTISIDRTLPSGTTAPLSYRTGSADAVWVDDFSGTSSASYVGDFYGWGSLFNTAVESGGTIKLSDPVSATVGGNEYVDFLFDSGKSDKYFPAGSVVTTRVKVNSDTRERTGNGWLDYVFIDGWWGFIDSSTANTSNNNQWQTISFTFSEPFSKIGFELVWDTGTWQPTDTFEVDYIKITTPDSFGQWNAWSTPCSDRVCAITPADLVGNTWIQYKLDLTTTNPSVTPKVNSVTYQGDYQPSGTYTSTNHTYTKTNELQTFNVTDYTPAGTSINYEYSLDNGTTWQSIVPGHTFANNTNTRSFIWRATLLTTDPTTSPTITSVSITAAPAKNSSTSTATRGIPGHTTPGVTTTPAEAKFKQEFPELFTNGTPSQADIQKAILNRAEKVVSLLEQMMRQREEGE